MVVFTCNNCGESGLQKPRVVKHISYECKKKNARVSLCCVDCFNDFDSNTYVEHTKCKTELERYSGSNFTPKASSNKGERKQNSWINIVRTVLDRPTLNQNQRELLQAISNFENVPRKKAKFQNFIKSSLRHIRTFPDVVDTVFDLLDKEFKTSTTTASNDDAGRKRTNSEKAIDTSQVSDGTKEAVKSVEECETVKRKKQKATELDQNEEVLDNGVALKKKKKKKDKEDVVVHENGNHIPLEETKVVNEKVHKKKRKLETPLGTIHDENGSSNAAENANHIAEKKRKFEEIGNSNACESVIESKFSDCCESQSVSEEKYQKDSKKKKKRKRIDPEDTILNENNNDGTDVPVSKEKQKTEIALESAKNISEEIDQSKSENEEFSNTTTRFDWKAIVMSILSKSENHELSLKKMNKKVVRKYQQFHQDDKPSEDIIKKFGKKVKKMANVEICNERIRLQE